MKCPSCSLKIGIINNVGFIIRLAVKKTALCPYCNINIYKQTNQTWEYFEQIFCVIFLGGFGLFLLTIIYSRQVGFKSALSICFWIWIVIVLVFFLIMLINLVLIIFNKMYVTLVNKQK